MRITMNDEINPSIETMFDKFIREKKIKRSSEATIKYYNDNYRYFRQFF